MKPSQLSSYLDKIFEKKIKHTTFIWGNHGVSKSTLIKAAAMRAGYKPIDFRVSQLESIDVAGLYHPTNNNGVMAIENLSPTYYVEMIERALANNGNSKICLFFDEFNLGRREVMSSAFEIVLDRTVKGKKIPDDVVIICAGNPENDNYDTTTMSDALKDRLIHLYLNADKQDFSNWAENNGIRKDIIQFANSGHMTFSECDFRAKLSPSPRSLARLSDLLNMGFNKEIEDEVILGVLGLELGVQFIKNRQEPEKAFDAEEMMSFNTRPEEFARFKTYCDPKNTRLDIIDTSMNSFCNFIDNNNIDLSSSQVESIGMFMMELPAESLFKFWKGVNDNYEKSYNSQKTIESITVPMYTGNLKPLLERVLSLSPTTVTEAKSEELPF